MITLLTLLQAPLPTPSICILIGVRGLPWKIRLISSGDNALRRSDFDFSRTKEIKGEFTAFQYFV